MNRCPLCSSPVTTTAHDRPILLDADGGPHAATCAERVRVARVVPCVTPTGRTDCHGQYIERDDEGRSSFACALAWLISNASEDCYCAGWDSDCEHILWDAAHAGGDFDWGMGVVTRRTLDAMLVLSSEMHGWVRYVDGVGAQFVWMPEWETLHAEWRKRSYTADTDPPATDDDGGGR